ncbi:SWIM zinc finger family protein [Crinalium epipsammum]|uniref:SWIM zinc finger family protein n=1 Tax=Crinalium epipsammum TaxID=241425 RepID=UPI0003082EB9|nr:SWIM zinc finger family protein [Crinalium epipsammum]
MPIPKLDEATIRRYATAQSFERGEVYYHSGAVTTLNERGYILQAEVEGNQAYGYRVSCNFDDGGIREANCTCPYDWDGWCKHIVAVLLVCIREPQRIEQLPSLEQLLDRLDLVQTQRLVQDLVAQQPELISIIDRFVNLLFNPAPQQQQLKPQRLTPIDPKPFRQQVKQILRDGIRGLEYGEEDEQITENLLDLIQSAQEFSHQGDGNNALVILEAITAACVEDWDNVYEYGLDNDEVASALNEAWTQAILTAELTDEEQVDLRVNLEAWQDE